jgi:hypothetical protein
MAVEHAKISSAAPDFVARVEFLSTISDLHDRKLDVADRVDAQLDWLDHHGQHELSGLLGSYMGSTILEQTGNVRFAAGYLTIAYRSYVKSGSTGFAQQLYNKYPDICPGPVATSSVLPESFPPLGHDSKSQNPSSLQSDSASGISSSLDALT